LVRLAGRVLSDDAEADDVVQQAWLRLQGSDREIANLPGWLTAVGSFGFDFAAIAAILGGTPAAVRKLASRARAKMVPARTRGRARRL
jgi:DNA-directed RNA polymerase specialized sigma24 family protein